MKRHFNIRIYGLVQGVSFRYYSGEKARELGLFGLVRNERDGTVYIEVEGSEEKLNEFADWCKRGPGTAAVEKVEVDGGEVKDYRNFVIR